VLKPRKPIINEPDQSTFGDVDPEVVRLVREQREKRERELRERAELEAEQKRVREEQRP
jgi:hypothetical protein